MAATTAGRRGWSAVPNVVLGSSALSQHIGRKLERSGMLHFGFRGPGGIAHPLVARYMST
jgi:hypothetical protein